MRSKIDINCDLGESFGSFKVGNDSRIIDFISSANIACGFHAGDPNIMAATVKLAGNHGVAVGAHPGYPDLIGFGRREMALSQLEIKHAIIYQVGALRAFAIAAHTNLQHVKPHGALYNTAAKSKSHARGVTEAVQSLDANLVLFAPANSELAKVASSADVRVAQEVFADRAYNSDGTLVSRQIAGAIIRDPDEISKRATQMVKERRVTTIDGKVIRFEEVHTICVHGDTPNATAIAKALKKALLAESIEVSPVGTFI